MRITIDIEPGEVLVALQRPTEYADTRPQLVAEDAIVGDWVEWRVIDWEAR